MARTPAPCHPCLWHGLGSDMNLGEASFAETELSFYSPNFKSWWYPIYNLGLCHCILLLHITQQLIKDSGNNVNLPPEASALFPLSWGDAMGRTNPFGRRGIYCTSKCPAGGISMSQRHPAKGRVDSCGTSKGPRSHGLPWKGPDILFPLLLPFLFHGRHMDKELPSSAHSPPPEFSAISVTLHWTSLSFSKTKHSLFFLPKLFAAVRRNWIKRWEWNLISMLFDLIMLSSPCLLCWFIIYLKPLPEQEFAKNKSWYSCWEESNLLTLAPADSAPCCQRGLQSGSLPLIPPREGRGEEMEMEQQDRCLSTKEEIQLQNRALKDKTWEVLDAPTS